MTRNGKRSYDIAKVRIGTRGLLDSLSRTYRNVSLDYRDPDAFESDISMRLTIIACVALIITVLPILAAVLASQNAGIISIIIIVSIAVLSIFFKDSPLQKLLDAYIRKPLKDAWNDIHEKGKALNNFEREQLHMYYIGSLLEDGKVKFRHLRLASVDPNILSLRGQMNERALDQKARGAFLIARDKRRVRDAVCRIPPLFWRALADNAVIKALDLEDDALDANEPCSPPALLASDIYVYLSAWLVCSIDNDGDYLMPVDVVELRYKPGISTSNVEFHIKALEYVQKILSINSDIWEFDDPGDIWDGKTIIDVDTRNLLIPVLKNKLNELKRLIRINFASR